MYILMRNSKEFYAMPKKLTFSQITERLIYLLAVILAPGIPLFFLYSQNAAQGLLFKHFLITGGVLAVISLAIYLPVSKLFLRRRRAMILIALCWAAFWFFHPLGKIIAMGDANYSQRKTALYLLVFIVIAAFILRRINMSRLAANTTAVLLCLLFAFNFIPEVLAVSAGEKQRVYNERTGELPYEIKTVFNIDPSLPHPNVYWLHMDGMMGFDAVERYFNDPQTALKNDLAWRGFVINKGARLEAGYTYIAIPAMTSPVFYDSYLAAEFARVAQLTRNPRQNSLSMSMTERGFSLDVIYPQIEILKALSDAGYINIGNRRITASKNVDIQINGHEVINDLGSFREKDIKFNKIVDFINLITDAGALSVVKSKIDEILEKKRPAVNTQPIPSYQETVDKYVTGSDSDNYMAEVVKAMKYAASIQTPHFVYFTNGTTHCNNLTNSYEIGGVTYDVPIGRTFILDENGNVYKKRLDDPNDVHLYLPQHKYTVKQMIAQIYTMIENDPDAVIILQGDHGIHGIGNGADYFDSKFMFERGYSLEDQLNLNLHVISAVRIPPQYGKLSQPLDPLDIARYLVNNFVGKGNYDYLYYTEEDSE
jgi:hypothetical protein